MKRNRFLDFAKGILILLVTIGHSLQFAVYPDQNAWDDPLYKAIYMFHMPLFMAISGYLAYPGFQRTTLGKLTWTKSKAYLIPIFAWASFYKLVTYAVHQKEPLASLPNAILWEAIDGLWFLWALLACLILTAAVKAIGRFFWPIYGLSFFLVLLLPDWENVFLLKFMLPFFMAGYWVASRGPISLTRKQSIPLLTVASILTLVFYSLWHKETYAYVSHMELANGNYWNVLLRYGAGFAASLVVIFGLHFLYPKVPAALSRLFEVLGRDSIYIYIMQGYIFLGVLRIAITHPIPVRSLPMGWLIALLLGTAIAWICWGAGHILARNDIIAAVFFGKSRRPKQEVKTIHPGHP